MLNTINSLGKKMVSLVHLRKQVAMTRVAFDKELHSLRMAGLVTMTASEARNGRTQDEIDACIREDSCLLLYVSIK